MTDDLPITDASVPGVLEFGEFCIFSLGEKRYIIVVPYEMMKNTTEWREHIFNGLGVKEAFFVYGDAADIRFTPLEQSADLRALIHQIVLEELNKGLDIADAAL